MKFTKKQFDEIGPWHFNDLCFDSTNQKLMLRIFNLLPSNLQGLAVSWGCNDSVFRDDVFEYLIKNQFDMTLDEYYESDIFNKFINNGVYQQISLNKLNPKIVKTVIGYQQSLTKMMSTDGYAKGELGIIMVPHGVGKYNPAKGRYDEKINTLIEKHKNNA